MTRSLVVGVRGQIRHMYWQDGHILVVNSLLSRALFVQSTSANISTLLVTTLSSSQIWHPSGLESQNRACRRSAAETIC